MPRLQALRRPQGRGRPSSVKRLDMHVLLAAAWLVLLFLVGGSARADVPYLVVLRPLSVALLGLAVWRMDLDQWRTVGKPAALLLAFLLLALLHLVPLPPAIWRDLPNLSLVRDIYDSVGLGQEWRPLSLAPAQTWNAAMSTMPVLALVLLLGLRRRTHWPFVLALLGLGLASVILGVLQVASGSDGALYVYRFFNGGSPIGFFANRNHQAVFLATMIPLATAVALRQGEHEGAALRKAAALGLVAIFLITIAVLGSRAGLLTAALAIVWSIALWWRLGPPLKILQGPRKWIVVGGGLVLGAAVLVGGLLYASSVERVRYTDFDQELRFALLEPLADLTVSVLPFGTGIGTFVEAYRAAEPDELLRPNYLNHAHNDWLEWALTGGVPLMLLILLAAVLVLRVAIPVWREPRASDDTLCAHWALAALVILAIASLFDYPLRTPALAGVAGLAAVWLNRFELSRDRAVNAGRRWEVSHKP